MIKIISVILGMSCFTGCVMGMDDTDEHIHLTNAQLMKHLQDPEQDQKAVLQELITAMEEGKVDLKFTRQISVASLMNCHLKNIQNLSDLEIKALLRCREGKSLTTKKLNAILETLSSRDTPVALWNLGWIHARGLGVEKDEAEGAKFYSQAADQGYAAAQYNLGLIYDNGQGVKKNQRKAAKLYRLAADQGHVAAQVNLGLMYAEGLGGEKTK